MNTLLPLRAWTPGAPGIEAGTYAALCRAETLEPVGAAGPFPADHPQLTTSPGISGLLLARERSDRIALGERLADAPHALTGRRLDEPVARNGASLDAFDG